MSASMKESDARYASLDVLNVSEEKCGLGRFTPMCLQRLANPKTFALLIVPTLILFVAAASYTGAVLTSVEKEFQLSSTESGFLTVLNDITTVIFVVFLSFIGHNAHRPRWIGMGILLTGIGVFICSFPHFSKEEFDISSLNGDFEIPDYCFIRNLDFSKIPGFDPSRLPQGFDPSKLPEGFDPSKFAGFDPSKLPGGFDPSKLPEGFDPSKFAEGFDPSKLPDGFDPSKLPEGFDPSNLPGGFDSSFGNISIKTNSSLLQSVPNTTEVPDISQTSDNNRTSASTKLPLGFPFGSNMSLSNFGKDCDEKSLGLKSTTWLIIGLIMQGIGWSFVLPLALTYLDDSLPSHQTVFYAALMFLAIAFGPIIGFLTSSWSLSLFVDFDRLDKDEIPKLSQYDPRWLGAWWLGYICIGAAMIALSVPFFLFPRKMPSRFQVDDGKHEDVDTTFIKTLHLKTSTEKGLVNNVKCFLKTMKRLFTNLPLILLYIGLSAEFAIVSIFLAFVVKYIVIQFGVTPVTATIIVGGVISPCSMFGNVFAGVFCRRYKLGFKKSALFIVVCTIITFCLLPVLMFAGCSNPHIAGITSHYYETSLAKNNTEAGKNGSDSSDSVSSCNSECFCPDELFLPVCGSDGVTYTSGCHAGCSQKSSSGEFNPFSSNTNYSGCTCINDPDSEDGYGNAVSGMCSFECNALPMYVIIAAIVSLVSAMKASPAVSIMLRIVEDEDRSVAVGLQQFLTKVIGYFPAPIYFGAVINSMCLLWQTECDEEGACLIYDIEQFRFGYFGLVIGLKALALISYLITYCSLKETDQSHYKTVQVDETGCQLEALNSGAKKRTDGNAIDVEN